ncbi:MAG: GyrI-like domain-containing protein [Candidatus Thorarchaeota archaeon]
MEKVDHKKIYREFYNPPKKPTIVDVPEFNFIMLDGKGDPNTSQDYQEALMALYSVAFTVKFAMKKDGIADFTVMPLEGLWWLEGEKFDLTRKNDWSWTSMIMQPEQVSKQAIDDAKKQAIEKRDSPFLRKVRFRPFHEGKSIQIMYLGPYADEGPTINMLHEFAENQGLKLRGKHHEIYLSDPRRTAPERLRTVIRQPVK